MGISTLLGRFCRRVFICITRPRSSFRKHNEETQDDFFRPIAYNEEKRTVGGQYNIKLQPCMCAYIDPAYTRDRKQEQAVCRKYIREHKTVIDILLTMKKYEGRYERILPVLFEMGIEPHVAHGYMRYLTNQDKDVQALTIAEHLLEQYADDITRAAVVRSVRAAIMPI